MIPGYNQCYKAKISNDILCYCIFRDETRDKNGSNHIVRKR